MEILFKVIATILVADLISGIGHWIEDTYGNPNTPVIGDFIVKPNLEHHQTPRSFLQRSYWSRNGEIIIFCLFITFFCYLLGESDWTVYLLLLIISQVNEFHALSHRRVSENPKWVSYCQKIGFIQSQKHHGWHHKAPYDCNYCIITMWLNPVLEYAKFWQRIEYFLALFGIKPLRGEISRNGV